MDLNILKKLRNPNTEEHEKKGRRSILDVSAKRKNFSQRQSFDIIRQHCPECGHDKSFDKTTQGVTHGIYCTRCGYKHKGREE